ncbi:hypothetical protein NEF87_002058 [Candidatus Lokiarchaeum ossiferum]|uniref:Uncharacterized protein n=1 Tax=Candidatus Lokiarchaeum ossiferum TaxID=2951803 RepID=A0ABY6HQJ0_9ARCH|nr:hypothetical protein NEF87_002058 [Candidatus Lokiarchaeum sp. B-35]
MQKSILQDREEILKNSKKHYFSLGVDDGAASLCKNNFQYGLAKMHYVQNQLGGVSDATFISTPDETISRNRKRWESGYGYGGKLTYGDKKDPFIFIDTKPNACGMLVGGLDKLPKPDEIIKQINTIITQDSYIDDIKLQWDFKKGNHFIDVFQTDQEFGDPSKFPKYMFVIHGSVPELRNETSKGPGLYYDSSKTLYDMCNKIETPFGPSYYLDGTNAREYFEFFKYAKKFAAEKREKVAELLFGKFDVISNPMHQGLLSYGEILLGAQHITDDSRKLFPVALRSDLPLYIVSALPNLSDEQIDDLGFENRAKKLGVLPHLQNLNVLPHGGGYALPHINCVKKVLEIDGERFFVCEQEMEDGITIFSDVAETQFLYRGKKIINKIESLSLGTIEAKLHPKFVLKI